MAESACVNQTIGSLLGRSILWVLAGEPDVTGLGLFASPDRAGFGGRQAFSKGNDAFFSAIQSVIVKSKAVVDDYDAESDLEKKLPEWGVVAFPVIVVKGTLFEAYMDRATGDTVVEEQKHIRLHWRGSDAWNLHASVDVASDDYVSAFATVARPKRAR